MDNDSGISYIVLEDEVTCWCPMGKQWYTAELTIRVIDPVKLADFIEVGELIQSKRNESIIIEDLTSAIHKGIKEMYGGTVVVATHVKRGKHLPVTVVKEDR